MWVVVELRYKRRNYFQGFLGVEVLLPLSKAYFCKVYYIVKFPIAKNLLLFHFLAFQKDSKREDPGCFAARSVRIRLRASMKIEVE